MKKAYVKPEVYFESFELSSSIAVQCAKPINYAAGTCKEGLGGYADLIFLDTTTTCQATPDKYGYCYDVPNDTNRIFNSL